MKCVKVNKNNVSFLISHTCHETHDWWLNNYEAWEPFTFKVFDHYLTPKSVYIDLGTFTGHTILYAAQKVKSAYGIELDPMAYEACKKNVLTNNLKNVNLINCAVANYDGEVGIKMDRIGTSGCGFDPQSSMKITCLTIESLLKVWGIKGCDFIKMDIEGSEEVCLPAMSEFLSKHTPDLLLSLHKHLGAKAETISNIKELYNFVYNKDFKNVKDILEEVINNKSHEHGEQDYLFTNKPFDININHILSRLERIKFDIFEIEKEILKL